MSLFKLKHDNTASPDGRCIRAWLTRDNFGYSGVRVWLKRPEFNKKRGTWSCEGGDCGGLSVFDYHRHPGTKNMLGGMCVAYTDKDNHPEIERILIISDSANSADTLPQGPASLPA